MLPKAFLVDDLGHQLGAVLVDLAEVRRRLLATQRTIETQKRQIEALRKRVDRQAAKLKKAPAYRVALPQDEEEPTAAPCSHH